MPGFAIVHNNKGNAYNNLKEYEKAIMSYTEAIDLMPKEAKAYILNRSDTYYQLAKQTTDPVKKAEYTALAEADKKKYDELNKAQGNS